jgi:hypothetical protein
MSTLLLGKNGRVSSSKKSKHIKAKYFLIKDYYDAGEIDLRYCSTDAMWADVLTKLLQGQKSGICALSYRTAREIMMMNLNEKKRTRTSSSINEPSSKD